MSDSKKILISGASGMLGSKLKKTLFNNGFNEIYFISKSDTTQSIKEKLFQNKYLAFFHCAAETDLKKCQINSDDAFNANVEYTKYLVDNVNATSNFYISTDSVYEESNQSKKEDHKLKPINEYSKSKLLGEKIFMESTDNYYIIRTNIFGFNSKNKKSIFEWSVKELSSNQKIQGYSNIFFNPLYVGHVSEALILMLKNNIDFGVYNLGSDNYLSKYEFLINIAKNFNFNPNLIENSYYEHDKNLKRSLNTSLDCSKIKSIIRNFDWSIEKSFKMLYSDYKNEKD